MERLIPQDPMIIAASTCGAKHIANYRAVAGEVMHLAENDRDQR